MHGAGKKVIQEALRGNNIQWLRMVPTNSKNKTHLILTLITKFKEANIAMEQAVEDADTLIVTITNSLALHHESSSRS